MSKGMYLYGAGGHAKVIIEILQLNRQTIKGVFDDSANIPSSIFGIPFLGKYNFDKNDHKFIVAIGNNTIRKKIARKISNPFETAIHSFTSISKSSTIDEGTVVMSGVSINAYVEIGKHAIINTNASIDHDCRIGNFAHVSPNACLSGCVTVGEGTHIGAGAVVIPKITIGKWVTIGAGAVITKDVPDYAVVVGNPGKIIKYSND